VRGEPGRQEHQNELEREYERRFAPRADYRWRVWTLLTRSVFQRYVPPDGAVLELGCGWGEFINQIRARDKFGMDLNPASGDRLAPGVRFLHQDCSERWPLDDGALDTIFTSNFFEHLPDKTSLGRTLREAFRCLRRGGRLICLGPNIRALPGTYWDFWDHYLPLSDRSLAEGLELAGFTIERSIARFLPYTMARDRNPPLWMVSLYVKLPFVWPFLGRQFLVIASRP
jgi:SAM-dependent methyltransferase